jgi:cytochrome c oxidase cbb3-type subunit I
MTNAPTNAGSAEVTAMDSHARVPLLLLIGSGVVWLVISGILALIAAIQLHSPQFLADCSWFTFGRTQALRETAFIYGWSANAGLAIGLWVLGRLGGNPLRGLNWAIAGTLFWNLGVTAGLVGIAVGDMTSFSLLQLPRYVQPLLVFAYATIAISGVLAWSGRRSDGTFASQWYAVAALFLFPWMLTAAQAVLLWMPVRGTVQSIAAGWYAQGVWTLWLAPLALAGAYYIVPKVAGRVLPTYESASLGFWTLIFAGAWTGGRHLIGGPVPAWIPTMAIVAYSLLLFHYLVVLLNFRPVFGAEGTAAKFIRIGLVAYLIVGTLEFITAFRVIAVQWQFTLLTTALEQLGLYAGGHRVLVLGGVLLSVAALGAAGWTQSAGLLDAQVPMADLLGRIRVPLLVNSAAQIVLLGANLLLLVNFCRTACAPRPNPAAVSTLFRQPATLRVHAS